MIIAKALYSDTQFKFRKKVYIIEIEKKYIKEGKTCK